MGTVQISGTLTEAPPAGCEAPGFPSATTSVPFGQLGAPCPKPSPVSTGAKTRNVNSPSAFVALSGVGATDDVTQADTVYMRVKAGLFQFRITYRNPAGGSIVAVLPSNGIFLHEADAPDGFWITLLEVQGSGQIEYFASGQL